MIRDLSEDGKFITVSAFVTPSDMDPSTALSHLRLVFPRVEVQFFEGAHVAGKEHLEIAATNALRAFRARINISRSLAMEALLYASAQRQIDVAIRMLGVRRQSQKVGLVAFSESRNDVRELQEKIAKFLRAKLDDNLLDDWSDDKVATIMKLFGIDTVELEAIKMPGQETKDAIIKAVIERVALLSTRT